MHLLKLYAIVLPVFLAIDLTWLGVIMKKFYNDQLGELARRDGASLAPRWGAAILVYLLIPAGIVLFVRPLVGPNSPLWQAFAWGAAFGLVCYGTYDLTNYATLDKYTLPLTMVDTAWGTVLCGTTSVVMRLADGWLSK